MKLQQTEVWLDNDLRAWVTLGTELGFKENCQLVVYLHYGIPQKDLIVFYYRMPLLLIKYVLVCLGYLYTLKLISHHIEDHSDSKLMSNVGNHADINRQYDGTHP